MLPCSFFSPNYKLIFIACNIWLLTNFFHDFFFRFNLIKKTIKSAKLTKLSGSIL